MWGRTAHTWAARADVTSLIIRTPAEQDPCAQLKVCHLGHGARSRGQQDHRPSPHCGGAHSSRQEREVTGTLCTHPSVAAAKKRRLLVDLSMTSWRGWTDFLLGRVQFVGMAARQARAYTQHGRHGDASQVGQFLQHLHPERCDLYSCHLLTHTLLGGRRFAGL